MKQILITNTLALATKRELKAFNLGAPLERPEEGYKAPEGFAYVDNLDKPDDEDGYRWKRAKPTLDGYGWEQVEIVVLVPESVSMAQFQEELSKPAYNDLSGVALLDIVNGAVSTQNRQMQIWWDKASAVERNNAKVKKMARALDISDETLDAIFTGADQN